MIDKRTSKPTDGRVTRQPSHQMTPFEEMDRFFDSFFPRSLFRPMRWEWPAWSELETPLAARIPKVDVVDRDDEVVVRAELPGVDKENLDISLSEDTLTIKGTTRHESTEEKGDFHRREISSGSFSRSVILPAAVQGDKSRASFKDGMLELVFPKASPARRHSIKVD